MRTKSEQLEICRTCAGANCGYCDDANYTLWKIKDSLSGVDNIAQVNPMDEPFFGKAPCQTCGDKLAGDRYNLVAVAKANRRERVDFAVCVDCFGYLFA